MDQGFIDILKQLISEQGKEALLNTSKCKAFLADYAKGDYKKESRLLLQALDAGVQKEIDTTGELELCKRQQIKVLQEEHFLSAETAADIVDTLALVLKCEQESDTPQGVFCSKCGKELQKEWASCPYCETPAAKIQQNPPEAESPPVPLQETMPGALQTPSEFIPIQTLLNGQNWGEKKIKKRDMIIFGVGVLLIILRAIVPVLIESTSPQAYFNKGVSYYNNCDYDNAITQFNEAIRLDPNYVDAYANRGEAYRMKGQYDMAIKDLDNAIRLNSNFAFAYACRGVAYSQQGQKDLATKDLEKAISLNPNYDWAKERLKEIQGN